MKIAYVKNNVVINVVMASLEDTHPSGISAIPLEEGSKVCPGWTYNGVVFSSTVDASTIREDIWNAIKAKRDLRTETGGFKVAGKWFHSDQRSRNQQLGLVLLGANLPSSIQWKTMDGSFVEMTPILAQEILAKGAASDFAAFAAAEVHRAAMEASSDPSSYDFSSGWPPIFGE